MCQPHNSITENIYKRRKVNDYVIWNFKNCIWVYNICCFISADSKKIKDYQEKIMVNLPIILWMVLVSVSMLFPVENLFWSFKSPNEVLSYYIGGSTKEVISGNDSSMIIYYGRKNPGGHFIVPKSENGYKIPSIFSVKRVSYKLDRDGLFNVYNVSGTSDYYVVGSISSSEEEISVMDSRGEMVKNIIVEMGDTGIKRIRFFAFVENFTNEYYLIVNGERIPVAD